MNGGKERQGRRGCNRTQGSLVRARVPQWQRQVPSRRTRRSAKEEGTELSRPDLRFPSIFLAYQGTTEQLSSEMDGLADLCCSAVLS